MVETGGLRTRRAGPELLEPWTGGWTSRSESAGLVRQLYDEVSKRPRRLLTPCPTLDSDRGAVRAVAEERPWRFDVVDRMTHKLGVTAITLLKTLRRILDSVCG